MGLHVVGARLKDGLEPVSFLSEHETTFPTQTRWRGWCGGAG